MKLARYTSYKLSIILLILIGIWGTFFYFAINHEIMDETDDELRSYREVFISRVLNDPEILTGNESIFYRSMIIEISEEEAKNYREIWYDMVEYWPLDDEHIPMRVYKSAFRGSDNKYYELELRVSTLERDDLIQSLFFYLIALYIVLIICIYISIRIILKKSFKPLEDLISWLQNLNTGKPIAPLENKTNIKEFKILGNTAIEMSMRNEKIYQDQKQFIENASHELQTPLAIVLNKLELLAQNENITEKQLSEIDVIYKTLGKAVKLNKSLLLLTRINNKQFIEVTDINLNELVKRLINQFSEVLEYKNINLKLIENSEFTFSMNELLADALLSNLIKNSIIHNYDNGTIEIAINNNSITIKNPGHKKLDKDKIFKRFYREINPQKTESTGLGLAIVKSVTEIYGISIYYDFNNGHIFSLKF